MWRIARLARLLIFPLHCAVGRRAPFAGGYASWPLTYALPVLRCWRGIFLRESTMPKKPKKAEKGEKKRGRPSSYKPEFAQLVKKLCLLGLIDKQMAEFFEVSEQTFNAWKKEYPEFLEAIRAGKMKADAEVASKLYDRACGATWEEEQAFKVKTVDYTDGRKIKEIEEVKIVTVRRAAPPDTQALALWLHNRKSELWSKGPKAGGSEKPHEDALDALE